MAKHKIVKLNRWTILNIDNKYNVSKDFGDYI